MQVDQAERRVRRVGNRGERITDDDEPGGRHAELVNDIEDRPDNTTRFLVVGKQRFKSSGADKTTVIVSASDTESPGALQRLLEPIARHGISLTRIESRPSRKRKWDYVFFLDLEGHADDAPVAAALEELRQQTSLLRVLGSYPRSVL